MIFVTGGTGLIGSHLLLDLAKEGHSIKALKRSDSQIEHVKRLFDHYVPGTSLFESIVWVDGSLENILELTAHMEGAKQVYHCAAMVSFAPKDSKNILKVNIDGTANVVNAALDNGVEKFCHVSSTAAIGGKNKGEMVHEKLKWENEYARSNYATSKHYGEREVWRGAEEGLNVVIVNPCVVLGPGNWGKSSTSLIRQVWKGLRFYTTGANAFVDARDVSKVMIGLMKSEIHSERFLVASENLAYRDFFNQVATALSKKPPTLAAKAWVMETLWRVEKVFQLLFGRQPIVTKPTAQSASMKKVYSNEKIKKTLKMEFIPVAQSIRETCGIFLKDVEAGLVK